MSPPGNGRVAAGPPPLKHPAASGAYWLTQRSVTWNIIRLTELILGCVSIFALCHAVGINWAPPA